MDNTEEIIKEQLKKLPEDVKKAISSIDLRSKIKRISDKNHLHIDQAGNLETETMLVMLGLESPDDYKTTLKRELKISDTPAQAITFDVNKEIFMPIRESLKKINQEEMTETTEQESNTIHHSSLTESEEIKQQIKEQQTAKPVSAPPPPNLPTQVNLEAGLPSAEKKPTHVDPYREPTE